MRTLSRITLLLTLLTLVSSGLAQQSSTTVPNAASVFMKALHSDAAGSASHKAGNAAKVGAAAASLKTASNVVAPCVATSGFLELFPDTVSYVYQDCNGWLGVGGVFPGATLDVNGSINASGNINTFGALDVWDTIRSYGAIYALSGIQTSSINADGSPITAGGDITSNRNINATNGSVFAINAFASGGVYANGHIDAGVYDMGGSALLSSSGTTGNLFLGLNAGYLTTSGYGDTFLGSFAGGFNTMGYWNTFTGNSAGLNNTTGNLNTFSGYSAGGANTTGSFNTFNGVSAGNASTTGNSNTFIGSSAGYSNTTGSGNTYIGASAGYKNNGTNNIYLGTSAGSATKTENRTMRLGFPANISRTFVAGIWGSTVGSNGVSIYVDSNGQLGTVLSSRRFKEQIRDMGNSSTALMTLRPVTFLYKPEYDQGQRTLQYGLIAEEVAEVYPDLVAYEEDGQPYSVKYQYLTTMLLNEMQKQYRRVDVQADVIRAQQQDVKAQAEVIETQQQEIDGLKAQLRLQNAAFQERLSRLESMVGAQTQIAADLPHR